MVLVGAPASLPACHSRQAWPTLLLVVVGSAWGLVMLLSIASITDPLPIIYYNLRVFSSDVLCDSNNNNYVLAHLQLLGGRSKQRERRHDPLYYDRSKSGQRCLDSVLLFGCILLVPLGTADEEKIHQQHPRYKRIPGYTIFSRHHVTTITFPVVLDSFFLCPAASGD
jgi:hypothetical protein